MNRMNRLCFLLVPLILAVFLAPGPAQTDGESATLKTAQAVGKEATPAYRIYALRNGECQIAGHHAFHGGSSAETYGYTLYLWLVLGGDRPMLVDVGLGDVAEMNRGAAHVLGQPITQAPHETSRAQLRRFGLESFWVGGHTPGSTAYRIHTAHGWAVLTGDTVSLLANFERQTPIGVFHNLEECSAAFHKIRAKADIVLPSHDSATSDRWPPAPDGAPKYSIRAVKVGQCEVRDCITYQDSNAQETSTFFLYVWVIEGGPRPILVETGPKYPEEFSRSTAQYIPGGIIQSPEERTLEALRRHGIDPAQVSHVIATHLHADHYDYFDLFPNARLVVNRLELGDPPDRPAADLSRLAPDVRKALAARPEALQLVGDQEVVPGVRVVPLGCHSPGSQGVLVRTRLGPVLLAGDVVYLYENIERDRPTRSPDENVCRQALAKIRGLADIVLPAHDPQTLERWPDGLIGAR